MNFNIRLLSAKRLCDKAPRQRHGPVRPRPSSAGAARSRDKDWRETQDPGIEIDLWVVLVNRFLATSRSGNYQFWSQRLLAQVDNRRDSGSSATSRRRDGNENGSTTN